MNRLALLVAALALLALLRWAFAPHGRLPRFRVKYTRQRLRLRLHPGRGHASVFELWLRWGRFAAFRSSGRSRRSLSGWERLSHPSEHSIMIGRAHYRHRLNVPVDLHWVILAPPRTGKSALLGSAIIHFPGPVLSTTTKADLFAHTSGVRQRLGRVHVFNPQGIGYVLSTFRWSPIEGCEDPAVAIRRADGFTNAVSMSGTEDASFWSSKASSYLRGLFHAAALVGGDMRLVVRWALGSAQDAEEILAQAGAVQWAAELAELRGEAQKTAATVKMVLSRALSFMSDPALAQAVLPAEGDGLDFADFLADRGTLYMIADSETDDSPLAPLFACLASELHYTAEIVGQASPGGRLDPPFLMALDEITQTCPVPLPIWAADSGGKGIELISVVHGEAQLRGRWKDDGARVILDTAGLLVFLPGITDTSTLKMASDLCGQTALKEHGQDHHNRHDVMAPEMIRQLPEWRALVIRGGYSPVIAKISRVWKTRPYKQAKRRNGLPAILAPAPAPALLPVAPTAAVDPADFEAEPASTGLAPSLHLVHSAPSATDTGSYPWSTS
jgi:type IV secretory pathway TraG/TraD family ATPase VirD4